MARFRFRVGDTVALSEDGFRRFERESRGSAFPSLWKLGDRVKIVKKYYSHSGDEYMIEYSEGGEGRFPKRTLDERWEKVS